MSVKKFAFALILLLALLTLCSCERKEEVFFDKDFEATVQYTRLGKEFCAVYTRGGGCEKIRFISPKSLENVLATRENGSVTVSFDSLSFTSVSDIFSPFDLLAVCTAKKSGDNTFISDTGITVTTLGGTPTGVARGETELIIAEYRITERSGTQ